MILCRLELFRCKNCLYMKHVCTEMDTKTDCIFFIEDSIFPCSSDMMGS